MKLTFVIFITDITLDSDMDSDSIVSVPRNSSPKVKFFNNCEFWCKVCLKRCLYCIE